MASRKFSEIPQSSLLKQIQNNLGVVYILTERENKSSILKFESLGNTYILVKSYLDIYENAINWLKVNNLFEEWVHILPITEAGDDFIVRPYAIYGNSLNNYFDSEESLPLDELSTKFEEFRQKLLTAMTKKVETSNELILHAILRRTFIEPNGLTYFDPEASIFYVKEFVLGLEELGSWKQT